jgi:Zn-dependent protease with chaperone function
LLANLAPVFLFPIFFKFKPIEDSNLTGRLLELSRRAGTRVRGVFEWKLSEKSKKANAALVGLGNTRRIILADTLLEKFNADEVEAVLAHEFGHHVHHHVFRNMVVQTLMTFLGFYLANLCLLRWGPALGFRGLGDVASLPLLVLVGLGLSFVLLPVINAHSRRLERQADAYALKAIPDKTAFITSMEKLAAMNLSERRPAAWIEFIFHSHPSIGKRIQIARAA